MSYQPTLADTSFLLFDVLQAPVQLQALQGLTEADQPLMEQVLDEAGKFVAEVVAPLSREGDEAGCRWQDGIRISRRKTRAGRPINHEVATIADPSE